MYIHKEMAHYKKIAFQHYLTPWTQMFHMYRLSSLVATMVSYAISSGSRNPPPKLWTSFPMLQFCKS